MLCKKVKKKEITALQKFWCEWCLIMSWHYRAQCTKIHLVFLYHVYILWGVVPENIIVPHVLNYIFCRVVSENVKVL